jgi:P pilus assembly chaperone PapD
MPRLKVLCSGRQTQISWPGFFSFLITGMIFLAGLNTQELFAQGNLLITPRRVVFEGNKRTFDLSLANTGQDTATYAISVIQIRMTDEGGFEQIEEPEPGQKFADSFLRYFPRQVTLGPGESQTVKIQLQRSGSLVAGEYRSHFYFRAVPKPTPLGMDNLSATDSTAISVQITPVFGITIPVIIRIGESNTIVSLTDLDLSFVNDDDPVFSFTFNRTGNMSVYGDITVDYVAPGGKITRVGIANGVAVYTPNNIRHFRLALNKVEGVDYTAGTLRVIYSAPTDLKPVRYAEAELTLQR